MNQETSLIDRLANLTLKQWLTYGLWVSASIYITSIILLFTPFTYNIDEIKVAIMLGAGAWLWLIYAIYLSLVPHPGARVMRILWPLIGFLAVFCISLAFSKYRWVGWHNLQFYLYTMVMLFIVVSTVTTLERLTHACTLFTLLALLSCTFGILHYYGFFKLVLGLMPPPSQSDPNAVYWQNLWLTLSNNKEMLGTILSTDFFAAYLIMALPSSTVLTFSAPRMYQRVLGLVTGICMMGCIYLTQSNETMLGVAAFLVIFFIGYVWLFKDSIFHRRWKALVLGIAICMGVLLFLTWGQIVDRYENIDGAVNARGIIYGGAWNMFLDQPLLGHGPGTFRMVFPLFRSPDYWIHEISNVTLFAHNQFLGLLCETGIFGFIFYMWFLGAICWGLIREIRKHPGTTVTLYQFAFFGGLVAIHIQNFFSPNSRWVAPAIAYYTMLGLAIASIQVSRLGFEPIQERRPDSWTAGLLRFPNVWPYSLVGMILFMMIFSNAHLWPSYGERGTAYDVWPTYGWRYFEAARLNNKGLVASNQMAFCSKELRNNLSETNKRRYSIGLENSRNQAQDSFVEATETNPCFLTASYKLGHHWSTMRNMPMALTTYNNIHYYNPDYSEIHLNYGIILERLHAEGYVIDREKLEEFAQTLNKKLGREYALEAGKLGKPGPSARTARADVNLEQARQVLDLVKSLNQRDSRTRNLSLTELIHHPPAADQKAPQNLKDPLIWTMARVSLERATRVAHKPQVWASYVQMLYGGGDYAEVLKAIAEIYNDDIGPGLTPIYKWTKWNAKFSTHQDTIISWMDDSCERTRDYEFAIRLLKRLIADDPENVKYVELLNKFCRRSQKPEHLALALEHTQRLIDRNPMNWEFHKLAVALYNYQKDDPRQLRELLTIERLDRLGKQNQALAAPRPPKGNAATAPTVDDMYDTFNQTAQILRRMAAKEKDPKQKTELQGRTREYEMKAALLRKQLTPPQRPGASVTPKAPPRRPPGASSPPAGNPSALRPPAPRPRVSPGVTPGVRGVPGVRPRPQPPR